jgi:hypothetical protein
MRRLGFSAGVWTMLTTASMAVCVVPAVWAAELKPATVAAFDRYQRAAELAIAGDVTAEGPFLRIGGSDVVRQRDMEARLRRGEVALERLHATEGGRPIEIPSGMVHHWVGAVFVPGLHVNQAVALLQDYDRHAQVYQPSVVRSNVLERNGDRWRIFLRFFMKKVIAVTVNTESVVEFASHGTDRVASSIRSTRIAEVEDAGQANEREKPVGRDGGYLWRLNTYWRFLERGGGTYIECESITLTRDIPLGFGWLVGPFVTSIPRDTLTFTLDTTRRTLLDRGAR